MQIYRIDTYPAKSNSHQLGIRSESWVLRLDKMFINEEQARIYVKDMNRIHSDLVLTMADMPEEKQDAFVEHFCFGDEYWHLRRYFLGMPDVDKITKSLRAHDVRVDS